MKRGFTDLAGQDYWHPVQYSTVQYSTVKYSTVNGILLKRGFTDLAGHDYWHPVQIPSFHLNACRGGKSYYWEWNCILVTNLNFRIHISLQPNFEDLRYFIIWVLLDKKSKC